MKTPLDICALCGDRIAPNETAVIVGGKVYHEECADGPRVAVPC